MLTVQEAEQKAREIVADMKENGCPCSGCIAEVLDVYPITDNDYTLPELIEMCGYPMDYEKRLLYNRSDQDLPS